MTEKPKNPNVPDPTPLPEKRVPLPPEPNPNAPQPAQPADPQPTLVPKLKCSTPGCNCTGPLILHSACHPNSPTWATLEDGVLTITCAECKQFITVFAVKEVQ